MNVTKTKMTMMSTSTGKDRLLSRLRECDFKEFFKAYKIRMDLTNKENSYEMLKQILSLTDKMDAAASWSDRSGYFIKRLSIGQRIARIFINYGICEGVNTCIIAHDIADLCEFDYTKVYSSSRWGTLGK